MRLQKVGGPTLQLVCIRCGGRFSSASMLADLDGVPFRAYYCAPCAAVRRAERMAADIVQGPIVEVAP